MEAGYSKNADGYWERDGNVVVCDILSFGIFNHYGPIVARQLDNHGIKSSYSTPPDAWSRQSNGEASCGLRGHGGSVRDPYFTLRLYTGGDPKTYDPDAAPGPDNQPPNAYHWYNEEFNAITDEVFATAIDDIARLEELWDRRDGYLVGRAAGCSGSRVLPPHSDEHDLLDELADSRQPVRQRSVLAPHVPVGAQRT